MRSVSVRFMTLTASLAALYAALTLVLAPVSFAAVQFRVSEMLTLLPVFFPEAIPGLALGCLLSDLVGFFLGLNPVGLVDAFFGTAATLAAAWFTARIGKRFSGPVRTALAPLPPVVLNGLLIGLELTFFSGSSESALFWSFCGSVALGEAVVCYALGVPLLLLLERKDAAGVPFWRKIYKM